MALNFPITIYASPEFEVERKNRVKQTKFQDGYAHRSPDGVNTVEESVALLFPKITPTQKDTLVTFFDSLAGQYVNYQLPGDAVSKVWEVSQLKFKSLGSNVAGTAPVLWSMSFKLDRRYE